MLEIIHLDECFRNFYLIQQVRDVCDSLTRGNNITNASGKTHIFCRN